MSEVQRKLFPFRANDHRWQLPLGRFVDFYGADELANRIDVHPSSVYHWIGGAVAPHPTKAFAIRRIARSCGFSISLEDIYQNFLDDGAEVRRSFRQSQPARRVGESERK